MHPTIRIVVFLVFAGFLASGAPAVVAVAALMLATAYAVLRPGDSGHLLAILARLRYLWLSLALLYLWFTPGEPLWPALGAGSPTVAGVSLAALRIATLVLMTAAAHLLVQTASRAELIAGIEGLLRPGAAIGLNRERFALRLLLVLETVPRLTAPAAPARRSPGRGLAGLVARLEGRLLDVVARAEGEPAVAITVPALGAPSPAQWLWPVALGAILAGAGIVD